MYSIALHLGGGLWAICEVQVHLAAILAHKEASHHRYEYFRTFFRGNNDAVKQRMQSLELLGRAETPAALLQTALASDSDERFTLENSTVLSARRTPVP